VAKHASVGLGLAAFFLAIADGSPAGPEVAVLLGRAEALANASGSADAIGVVMFYRAITQHIFFDHTGQRQLCDEVTVILRERSTRVSSELSVLHSILHAEADFSGRFRPAAELAGLVDEAWRRGDPFSAITLTSSGAIGRLFQGDVDGLTRHLEQARRTWTRPRDYSFPDLHLMIVEQHLAHYANEPRRAFERMQADWPAIVKAQFLRVPALRFGLHIRRARAAFRLADIDPENAAALRSLARRDVRVVERERLALAKSIAPLLLGKQALAEQRIESGIAHLRDGIAACERAGNLTTANAVRRGLGLLLGGDEGAGLTAQGDAALRAMGAVDLEAIARVL
jgi:hypothetical protein